MTTTRTHITLTSTIDPSLNPREITDQHLNHSTLVKDISTYQYTITISITSMSTHHTYPSHVLLFTRNFYGKKVDQCVSRVVIMIIHSMVMANNSFSAPLSPSPKYCNNNQQNDHIVTTQSPNYPLHIYLYFTPTIQRIVPVISMWDKEHTFERG